MSNRRLRDSVVRVGGIREGRRERDVVDPDARALTLAGFPATGSPYRDFRGRDPLDRPQRLRRRSPHSVPQVPIPLTVEPKFG